MHVLKSNEQQPLSAVDGLPTGGVTETGGTTGAARTGATAVAGTGARRTGAGAGTGTGATTGMGGITGAATGNGGETGAAVEMETT